MRHFLRLLAVLAGFGLGFGAACLVRYDQLPIHEKPLCPKCGRRHDVHPVTYTPDPGPGGMLVGTVTQPGGYNRVVGTFYPTNLRPRWFCLRCGQGAGSE